MAPKLKIAWAPLSAAFAVAVVPPAAFVAESTYEASQARKMTHSLASEILTAAGLHDQPMAATLFKDYHNCLDRQAFPAYGKAQTLHHWSDRLSFLPGISQKIQAAADKEFRYSIQASTSCMQDTIKKIPTPGQNNMPIPKKSPWRYMT